MSPHPVRRAVRMARAIPREVRHSRTALRDWPRYAVDVLAYRGLGLWPSMPSHDSERQVVTRDGIRITYRRNRGDIQGIREVFCEEHYRIPPVLRPATLIDLGANIGLTSVWFAKRYGVARVVGVEPVGANVAIARRNLADNDVEGEIVEAAVGPMRGRVAFDLQRASNLGRVGPGALEVDMITMDDVLARLGSEADLVKLDIEGGEDALLQGDLAWLERVGGIIAELHPTYVDAGAIVDRLIRHGFRYLPAGSLGPRSRELFVRP